MFDPRTAKDVDEQKAIWAKHREYLGKTELPTSAYEFASAKWRYDYGDHKSPHDAWLESFSVEEAAHGQRSEVRRKRIILRLLGAFHDGHIEFSYEDVSSYSAAMSSSERGPDVGHGDLLYEEVQLTSQNRVRHVIEFEQGTLTIDCVELVYKWTPEGK